MRPVCREFGCFTSAPGKRRNLRALQQHLADQPARLDTYGLIAALSLPSLHSCTSAPAHPPKRHSRVSQSLPDGAVPATDSLDALGLQPSLAPSAGAQPPEPLPLVLFDANIGCSLQQLFRIIMGPDAVFIKAQHARHKYWDVSVGEWAKHAGAV